MAEQLAEQEGGSRPSFKVLFVDPQPDTVECLCLVAETYGWSALAAHSSAEALEYLAHTPVDAVVLDLLLPRISGMELAARLRKDPRHSHTVLVAYTAASADGLWATVEAQGFSKLILKPDPGASLFLYLDGLARGLQTVKET